MLAGGWTWRAYLPTGVAAAVGQTLLVVLASDWVHQMFDGNGIRYGPIGIAFSLVSWLFLHSIVLTASAAAGGVVGLGSGSEAAPGSDGPGEEEV